MSPDSTVYEGLPLTPLSPAELREFREILSRKKEELLRSYGMISEAALTATPGETAHGLSDVLNHPGEHAAEMFEQELSIDILTRLKRELESLQSSIRRIDRLRYGNCDNCRKPIPGVRLQAVPTAKFCLPCQIEVETTS